MTRINTYLTFGGNCRQAMTFYQECLGGELTLQTVGESPLSDQLPDTMKNNILHATLNQNGLLLLGSDMVADKGLIRGNSISLVLECNSEAEIHQHYAALAANGEATHPLENTFWGALFGGLTDQFGNHWLLNYTRK